MFKYTKKDVIDIATKNGFILNNTEKVLRLCDILNHFSNSTLSNYLALKGGTAINLFLLDLPRLSIDIDFDFAKAIVSLVDKINTPKSSYITDQCAPLLGDFSVKSIIYQPWHIIAQRQKCPVTALATGQIHIIPGFNTSFR